MEHKQGMKAALSCFPFLPNFCSTVKANQKSDGKEVLAMQLVGDIKSFGTEKADKGANASGGKWRITSHIH